MPSPALSPLARQLGLSIPLLLAPMAGVAGADLAIAIARAGGLGAIAAATLTPSQLREEVARFRGAIDAPLNLNFFAHRDVAPTAAAVARWRAALQPLHARLGLEVPAGVGAGRRPFDEATAALIEALRPAVVSFHFGLPGAALLDRVRATGALVLSSATTVAEARWLAGRGVDAVIAQGSEAGGHRGMFLETDVAAQPGLAALLPAVVQAVDLPVIAAGGIADAQGMRAALASGAAAVQAGTAFLRSPEAATPPFHRRALAEAAARGTCVTNVFTGRPARGLVNALVEELGPMSPDALPFPYAGSSLAALHELDRRQGRGDYSPMWAGEAAGESRPDPAATIARAIAGAD
ncbi:NAD(P)H-dependent flavin oxidoreductase [Pseudoxanthomonas sp. 10H]|uniref:NAD(P)H-dependent flavin oxidoreductase n=1 Tax=Pseudoxanthomonas sp. 10H TaxID=3242729 RepID=UPI003558F8D2